MSMFALRVARRATTKLASFQSQRTMAGYWNRDWRPAEDIPKTEEERRAAAKKYGLIPEDYEPYPDDGTGYGDYPNLPLVSAESRDPHALYDLPELKRNFGEPMPVDFDMIGEDRWDISKRQRHPLWQWILAFTGTMTGAAILLFLGREIVILPTPMMPKQMLYDGKKHYSFELEDA